MGGGGGGGGGHSLNRSAAIWNFISYGMVMPYYSSTITVLLRLHIDCMLYLKRCHFDAKLNTLSTLTHEILLNAAFFALSNENYILIP